MFQKIKTGKPGKHPVKHNDIVFPDKCTMQTRFTIGSRIDGVPFVFQHSSKCKQQIWLIFNNQGTHAAITSWLVMDVLQRFPWADDRRTAGDTRKVAASSS